MGITRAEKIINDNHELINRFVDLATCKDRIYDSRHRWFYSLISQDQVIKLQSWISADDIRSEIYLFIIKQIKHYKNSDFEFNNYLKKAIGWKVKDYLRSVIALYRTDIYIEKEVEESYDLPHLSFEWLLTASKIDLSKYQKYLLYLYIDKCYTINQISDTVLQERTTVRESLNKAKSTLRSYYASKN